MTTNDPFDEPMKLGDAHQAIVTMSTMADEMHTLLTIDHQKDEYGTPVYGNSDLGDALKLIADPVVAAD